MCSQQDDPSQHDRKSDLRGPAWCNQHSRYELVITDRYIPGTNIPADPHTPARGLPHVMHELKAAGMAARKRDIHA